MMNKRRTMNSSLILQFGLFIHIVLNAINPVLTLHPSSLSPPRDTNNIDRRDVLTTAGKTAALVTATSCSWTMMMNTEEAGATEEVGSTDVRTERDPSTTVLMTMEDPPPILSLPSPTTNIGIPRVGYSLYKTAPEQTERCVALALLAGISHLDVATQYGSNADVGKALQVYTQGGRKALLKGTLSNEKPELLDLCEVAYRLTEKKQSQQNFKPTNARKGATKWRTRLFLSHKLSNEEQSTDPMVVKSAVQDAMDELGVHYLDMVSIHSPLTDSFRRLSTYRTLLDLRDSGTVRSVGVCNYGIGPLQEIEKAGLSLPAVNQLEISPFNAHIDVTDWCAKNGVAVSCAAWSRLSSADGPTEQWEVLSRIAQSKGMTKAQLLVRWSLEKGYLCVPRSSSASKIERLAIVENSYGGVVAQDRYTISLDEMRILDELNINFTAGRLGRRDGWSDADVSGQNWDPTNIV